MNTLNNGMVEMVTVAVSSQACNDYPRKSFISQKISPVIKKGWIIRRHHN